MRKSVIGLFCIVLSALSAQADTVQDCMLKAKIFQNPSALAGAADLCNQAYFENLKDMADTCRAEAATKTLPGAEYAACQASLILGLDRHVRICEEEAEGLLEGGDALTAQIKAGAASGCRQLVGQATEICRENANKFTGLAQSAATSACEVAGF